MISSANPKVSLSDIILNSIAAGATTIKQGRVPLADNVPSLGASGKGFAIVTGTVYDGTEVGFKALNYLIYSGAPCTIVDDSDDEDMAVPFSISLAVDARNNGEWTVQNTGTKPIDAIITDLQVRYVGT